MMAMTTSNSTRVKAAFAVCRFISPPSVKVNLAVCRFISSRNRSLVSETLREVLPRTVRMILFLLNRF